MEEQNRIVLEADINSIFAYALHQNHVALIRNVTIKNHSESDIQGIKICVKTDVDLIEPYIEEVGTLGAFEEKTIKNLKIKIHGNYLTSLTEGMSCLLTVSVLQVQEQMQVQQQAEQEQQQAQQEQQQVQQSLSKTVTVEQELVSVSEEVNVLAYNQWPGLRYYPDLLAAFVMPNHPEIIGLMQAASKYLEKWTQDPSLDAYQSKDPNRVIHMAAAAYAAIQEKNITYASAPASFEDMGQRIRLVDEVIKNRMGNCMDMTVLYTALLEAMRLNPLLVMIDGHIFAGVWLVDDSFPDPCTDDPTQLEKRIAGGINELIVVESTAMCAGENVDFDAARKRAEQHVADYDTFEFTIDLLRARKSGVKPLPMRITDATGNVVEYKDRSDKEITAAPIAETSIIDLHNDSLAEGRLTKQVQWERKLLDLSMRNMLINMRISSSVVPVLTDDLASLEDALSEGTEYELLHRPVEWDLHEMNVADTETINDLGPYKELIALETKHHRLHAWMTEKELNKQLTKMYRSAKSSMEENGASTLYLTMGLLRWFDGIKTPKAHYAPIVLIPVDIIRKSANKGYVIRKRDDEAQINITLLEFLKQNLELEIAGLNPIPTDDHGIDIDKIFAIVRRAVMNQKMWDVVETAFIGNFSFSQFVMWNDMHNRADMLAQNKIVHALMEGAIDFDCTLPDNLDSMDAYLPVSVDASQLRAINMAASDVSFVLHGPPGTGKSQTITGMIANALTKGKTVLFVAEKMAALQVVQKRLAALGIGDFCLELHSNKAVKKNVLEQMKRGLEIGVWGLRTDYEEKLEAIKARRSELDDYAKKLHEVRNFGASVRYLIDEYESIPEQEVFFKPEKEFIENLTQSELEKCAVLLERLVYAGKSIGHPKGHMFAEVHVNEYSQSFRMNLEDGLYNYQKSIDELLEKEKEFLEATDGEAPFNKKQWEELIGYARVLITANSIPEFILEGDAIHTAFAAPNLYLSKKMFLDNAKQGFFSKYKAEILNVDLSMFVAKYAEANKKFFGKAKAIAAVDTELQQYTNVLVSQEMLQDMSNEIMQYKQFQMECDTAKAAVPSHWFEYLKDDTTLEDLNHMQEQWSTQITGFSKYAEKIRVLKSDGKYETSIAPAAKFMNSVEKMMVAEQNISDLLQVSHKETTEDFIEGKKQWIQTLNDNASALRDYIGFREAMAECERNHMADICKLYTEGLPHEEVLPVFYKCVYKALIWDAVEKEPALNRFTGNSFNEKIREYDKMEKEYMELTKQEMYFKLTHNLPTGYESAQMSKELAILRKAISSGGRGLSIRALFDQIPHVLAKLCPCLLMSPISVAQYLSADSELYDIVIFDEASQLPTCKAVGVLARGKNAIIVGDPNQMPPTSFFAGNMIDEDNLDIEDLDSILDDCLALGISQSHLKWHYRSRHESLIAFSNKEYYENSMLTFPSVNDREKRVKLCTVNGIFDRKKGRINEAEGRAVVNEVIRRYQNDNLREQTIGIVTFNISQQSLIEDLLQEEYKKDAGLDQWANEREETLFIKNLENVQGDERDVILFSVGFGPDEEGRLSLNFGPLNKEGGWKRLNVAVTRARSEMVVFSSMTPEMIDLNRTKAKGVEGLRAFLEFADKGRLTGENYGKVKTAKGIMKAICEEVEKQGLKVQRDVGHSNFKIDIAVVNPYNEEEYLVGIMLDGDTYKQSTNTKDREIAQINVLSGLGWKLKRVWAMDWWDNKEKEIESLMSLIEEQKELAKEASLQEKTVDEGPISEEIKGIDKKEQVKKGTGRKKKEDLKVSNFEEHERFSPLIPHDNPKDVR